MFVNFYNIYLKNNINDNFLLDDSVKNCLIHFWSL